MATLNEEQLSDIQNELKSANTEKSIAALLHKFAFDEFGIIDTASILEDECVCESCAEPRSFAPETIEEMEMIQYCWLELRQYIRLIYRLTMKGSLKSIDNYYQDYMKDIVSRLVEICDAHQIFLRLEAQVKEFIVEIKVLLLQILDRMAEKPKLPQLFLTGLMDRYSKVMSAANVIAPVLKRLEEEHLQKFSLTWKILNQRLFQTIIYSDVFFQNSVPLFLSQIGKPSGSEENKKLLKEFLKFDKELGNVEGSWVDIEANIAHYLQQRPSLSEKKKILIHDCEAFKVAKHKPENIPVLENTAPGYPPPNGINMDDIQTINIDGAETEVLTGTCECHVCLDPSGHTPVELIEQVIPLNPHRSGFHLYPHIHGTHRDFGSFLPKECQLPEYCGKITEQQLWDGSFAKGMNKLNKMDHPFHHHHHHHHHLHPLPKHHPGHPIKKRMDKATQKDQEVVQTQTIEGKVKVENRKPTSGERVDKATQKDQEVGQTNNGKVRKTTPGVTHNHAHLKDADSHHIHCSKHSDIKRVPFSESEEGHTVDDSHSENSQSDPRHCDCCYCEVFGHGLPSAAPMSRNYQEMRERLRLLLNKKKSKCKSNTVSPHQTAQKKQQTPGAPLPANPERDTRALEDLLDFIEGNEVKCRNEKKAAKKARQKEKKRILLNRKKREEEEKARLLEQQRKREEALAKKREEALAKEAEERARANNKSKKKNSKSNHENSKANHNNNNSNNNTNNSSNTDKNNTQKKPGPQMVTIKRVMEPHNSEPTVTITLRGATPNQDRVLYTLLNGQVCKVKDVPSDKKSINSGKSNLGKNNSSNPVSTKMKETPIDKGKLKKEKIFTDSSLPKVPNIKPVKELTNPTSIQINNAINTMSKKPSQPFNIADIKLPPGITITKVDPSTVQSRTHKIQETNTKKNNASQIRPSSEVIVVSTGKRKDQPALSKEPLTDNQNGKKKKNKKKNAASAAVMTTNGKGSSYPGLEIQPIKIVDAEKEKDLANRMSVLTISPYADNNIDKNDVSKKKKKRSKKSPPSDMNNEEWKLLDSVFAPKDIDLDDGEMDDAERELEAFKRFCLQSIPPERKEKVHLNIKDIVLKKKSASYDY